MTVRMCGVKEIEHNRIYIHYSTRTHKKFNNFYVILAIVENWVISRVYINKYMFVHKKKLYFIGAK